MATCQHSLQPVRNGRERLLLPTALPLPLRRRRDLRVIHAALPLQRDGFCKSCSFLGWGREKRTELGIFFFCLLDGHHVWEMEAKTDKEMCKPNSLVVEIPPFRNQRITSPVQVNFYVCNGKRKRSQYQLFTYLPANVPIIKTEPTDDYEPAQTCGPMNQGLSPLSKPYYSQQIMMPPDPGSCLVAGFASCQQRNAVMSPSPNASPKLHDLSSSPYKCIPNPGHSHLGLQQPPGGVPTIQEVPRSIVVHPSPPEQSSHVMLQPQVSQHLSSSCPLGYQQTLYPNSPSSPVPSVTQEPTYLQSCSPTHSSIMGQQQQQLPKVHRNESPTTQPLSLPELHEESNHNLAPIPVTIKREPEELDQMYLDDGKSSTAQVCVHHVALSVSSLNLPFF
uniref:Rel homology dimerisation domain-containing protein n=1 Tax=Cyanistes caeruleus TaxID=156563 RepID=A0A8C0U4J7_CYACU